MTWKQITEQLIKALEPLEFGPPVTHVYNPLVYAKRAHQDYTKRFGQGRKRVLLLGMNPGPWGMAQTGVPFGEIALVREWLGIETKIEKPLKEHPKRPIEGFACGRSEVSGRRLWGWIRDRFEYPERFFAEFFVANYCPLVFMEASGKNRTPNLLPKEEKAPLLAACDEALRRTVEMLQPEWVLGVGKFAADRAHEALKGQASIKIAALTHPSPANPKANRGWSQAVEAELAALKIPLG